MYISKTFQDWEKAPDKIDFMRGVVREYKGSPEFSHALEAMEYFRGENPTVQNKTIVRARRVAVEDENGERKVMAVKKDVVGNRIGSNHFFAFVTQENQHLLSNGVQIGEEGAAEKLGRGFNRVLARMGEYALIQGVCWGFFNHDRLECIPSAKDEGSGLVALLDERTSEPRIAIQFWQLSATRPMYYRLFEEDGVTVYREDKDSGNMIEDTPKQAYNLTVRRDAIGEEIIGGSNWDFLPVIPLFGNEEHQSELTDNIRSKIDAYDIITSDFADNLERANEVYWVLNNFGGDEGDVLQTLETINALKAVVSRSDGMGTSSAEPRTIEVPYAARASALELLNKQLYADYMALNMNEVTGGSLTNVAIEAAAANLNLKSERYGWCVFEFVQRLLLLVGVDTDQISFNRQNITNNKELIESIYMFRDDIDIRTALTLNPMVDPEQIDSIIANREAEATAGLPSVDALQAQLDGGDAV